MWAESWQIVGSIIDMVLATLTNENEGKHGHVGVDSKVGCMYGACHH